MIGLHFDQCNTFLLEMAFDNCHLNLSSFFKLVLKNTHFINCSLQEVEFSEADFSGSNFTFCDLNGAIFDNTKLEKADFSEAHNFSIDPERNRIFKAKFSRDGLENLLGKYKIIVV